MRISLVYVEEEHFILTKAVFGNKLFFFGIERKMTLPEELLLGFVCQIKE
jgi:hypothetical protein